MIHTLKRGAFAVVCCACLSPGLMSAVADPVGLRPGVPIVVAPDTPGPVLLAVADLRRDLEKVLGAPSPVIATVGEDRKESVIVIAGPGWGDPKLRHAKIAGHEAHGVHVARRGKARDVVLEGADVRGAIYAIYSFSDEFLGVPPLWYWADWTPTKRQRIEVPADTARLFPSPDVRWRAWFNNDTDFLTPWRGRSPANDAATYETILRLKYNTYEVNSIAELSANAPRYAARSDAVKAHARGLILTGHHISSVGSSLRDWERFWQREGKAPPKLSVKAVDDLGTFWRYHIEVARQQGFEMVWTIAFRGGGDIPFWETFEDAPQDMSARADILNDMLRRQVVLLKEVTGDPAPPMRVTFYNEGTTLLTSGQLRPPEEPSLIWNFVAARRDHFPPEIVRNLRMPPERLRGYYLNFQFTSTGSHLAAAEGPWKMADNYRALAGPGTSSFVFTVVNAGNIREHVTELSANAEMMWRFAGFDGGRFLEEFSARYFGREIASEVASLYREFYLAYWNQKPGDLPGFERQYLFQDMRYARAVEMLLKDMVAGVSRPNPLEGHPLDNPDKGSVGYFRVELGEGDRNQIDALLRGTGRSGEKFAQVHAKADALRPRIAGQGRRFFDDNLRLRAHLMVQVNAMLRNVVLAYRADSKSPDRIEHLKKATQAVDLLKADLAALSEGVMAEWYSSDRVFGVARLENSLLELIAQESR